MRQRGGRSSAKRARCCRLAAQLRKPQGAPAPRRRAASSRSRGTCGGKDSRGSSARARDEHTAGAGPPQQLRPPALAAQQPQQQQQCARAQLPAGRPLAAGPGPGAGVVEACIACRGAPRSRSLVVQGDQDVGDERRHLGQHPALHLGAAGRHQSGAPRSDAGRSIAGQSAQGGTHAQHRRRSQFGAAACSPAAPPHLGPLLADRHAGGPVHAAVDLLQFNTGAAAAACRQQCVRCLAIATARCACLALCQRPGKRRPQPAPSSPAPPS